MMIRNFNTRISPHQPSGVSKRNRERRDRVLSRHTARRRAIPEVDIDRILEDSFPASDPPPWTLGVPRRSR